MNQFEKLRESIDEMAEFIGLFVGMCEGYACLACPLEDFGCDAKKFLESEVEDK